MRMREALKIGSVLSRRPWIRVLMDAKRGRPASCDRDADSRLLSVRRCAPCLAYERGASPVIREPSGIIGKGLVKSMALEQKAPAYGL